MPAEDSYKVFISGVGVEEEALLIGHLWTVDGDICGFSPIKDASGESVSWIGDHLHKQVGYLEEE